MENLYNTGNITMKMNILKDLKYRNTNYVYE